MPSFVYNSFIFQNRDFTMFARMRLFQKAATAILITFMSLMVCVTIVAYSRPSGFTRQDMARAHLIREEATQQAKSIEDKVVENR